MRVYLSRSVLSTRSGWGRYDIPLALSRFPDATSLRIIYLSPLILTQHTNRKPLPWPPLPPKKSKLSLQKLKQQRQQPTAHTQNFALALASSPSLVAGQRKFKAIAVATDISPPASPCGMCRQFMSEFTSPSFPVYMYDKDMNCTIITIGQLLPSSFGPDDFNNN
ncbi:cytidine deaminase-like protein [Aspergillus carlsbadensis]|nr:cytidine deaminase-like protein [Aspergillus carlsbadensis]